MAGRYAARLTLHSPLARVARRNPPPAPRVASYAVFCPRRFPLSTGRASGLALLPLAAALAAPPPATFDDPRPLEEKVAWFESYSDFATDTASIHVLLNPPTTQTFWARFYCPSQRRSPDADRLENGFMKILFDFGDSSPLPYRPLHLPPVKEPVQVGLWSRRRLAGGGYALTHETVLLEDAEQEFGDGVVRTIGPAALELARKIRRASSFSWTLVRTGRSSGPHPVTDEGRAALDKLLDFCGFSREPRVPSNAAESPPLALLPLAATPPPGPADDPRPFEERFYWVASHGKFLPNVASVGVSFVPSSPPYGTPFRASFRCYMNRSSADTGRRRLGDGSTPEIVFHFGHFPDRYAKKRYRRRSRPLPKEPVQVGLWSPMRLAAGGYTLTHETVLLEDTEPWAPRPHNMLRVSGPAALDLMHKIRRADSFSWTLARTGRSSGPHPVTAEGRTMLGDLLDLCGFSHETPGRAATRRGSE